jgi:hypothetical protein
MGVMINSRRVSMTNITIHLVDITSIEEGTTIQEVEEEVWILENKIIMILRASTNKKPALLRGVEAVDEVVIIIKPMVVTLITKALVSLSIFRRPS